ncbi:MAG: beta-ketoacyl-ACP synthase III [Planctomycetota bacterium]
MDSQHREQLRERLSSHPVLCSLRGLGRHLPERELTNSDMEKMVDTSDEWIVQRTGISSRRILADDEITSDLASAAAKRCMEDAGVTKDDIDALIIATITPDHICPSTACVVQRKLGMENIPAFDISVACSGFGYGLTVGGSLVKSGLYKNVLVVGAEAMSRFMDYEERSVSILFGDGAGAALLAKDGRYDMLFTANGADGGMADMIEIPGGGAREPASQKTLDERRHFVRLRGREVFKTAVRQMSQSTREACETLGITPQDLDWFIPHQANARIIEAVGDQLELPTDRVIIDLGDKGNTTAASIPIALTGLHNDKRFEPGDLIGLVGFGAGAAWSCQVLRFNG